MSTFSILRSRTDNKSEIDKPPTSESLPNQGTWKEVIKVAQKEVSVAERSHKCKSLLENILASKQLTQSIDLTADMSCLDVEGNQLAVGSLLGRIFVFDKQITSKFKETLNIKAHSSRVISIKFSADNKTLVTGDDAEVKFWSQKTSKSGELINLEETSKIRLRPNFKYHRISFNRGSFNLIQIDRKQVKLWIIDNFRNVYLPWVAFECNANLTNTKLIRSCSLQKSGLMLTQNEDGILKVWIIQTLMSRSRSRRKSSVTLGSRGFKAILEKEFQTIEGKTRVFDMSWDKTLLACGSFDNAIYLWGSEIKNGKLVAFEQQQVLKTKEIKIKKLLEVRISLDKMRIYSFLEDHLERKWVQTWSKKASSEGLEGKEEVAESAKSLAYRLTELKRVDKAHFRASDDIRFLVMRNNIQVLYTDKKVVVWRPDGPCSLNQSCLVSEKAYPFISDLIFSEENNIVVTLNKDSSLAIWRKLGDGDEQYTDICHLNEPKTAYLSRFSKDKKTQKNDKKGPPLTSVTSLAMSINSEYIIAGFSDNKINIWVRYEFQFGDFQTLEGHYGAVLCVEISKDNKRIFSSSKDSSVKIWKYDFEEGAFGLQQNIFQGVVLTLTLSLDSSSLLLSCLGDGHPIELFRLDPKDELYKHKAKFKAHKRRVTSLAISGDNLIIATGSLDKKVKIWMKGSSASSNGKSNGFSTPRESKRTPRRSHMATPSQIGYPAKAETIDFMAFPESQKELTSNLKDAPFEIIQTLDLSEKVSKVILGKEHRLLIAASESRIQVYLVQNLKYILLHSFQSSPLFSFNEDFSKVMFCRPSALRNLKNSDLRHSLLKIAQGLQKEVPANRVSLFYLKDGLKISDSYDLTTRLISVFEDTRNLIGKQELFHLIQALKRNPQYYDQIKIHTNLNILMLCVIGGFDDLLRLALEQFGYNAFFFEQGFDPLDYTLKLKNEVLLDEFARYFEENPLQFFDEDFFFKLLNSPSVYLKEVAVKNFILPAKTQRGLIISKMFPLNTGDGFKILETHKQEIDPQFKESLDKKAHSRQKGFRSVKVNFFTSAFRVDLKLSSPFSDKLLRNLLVAEDSIITSDLKYVVREIWRRNKWIIWVYAFFNWGVNFLFIYYMLYSKDAIVYPILATIMILPLFMFEVLVARESPTNYLNDYTNILDIYQYAGIPIIMFLIHFEVIDDSQPVHNTVIVVSMIIFSIRSFLLLKVIDGVRYLVAMIKQVFIDMVSFLIMLAWSILVVAYSEIEISKMTAVEGETSSFIASLSRVYDLLYTQWTVNQANFTLSQFILFYCFTIFLPLIMFNLLIAIISKTYEQFEENKEVYGYRETIDLLVDLKTISKLIDPIRGYEQRFIQLIKEEKQGKNLLEEGIEDLQAQSKANKEAVLRLSERVEERIKALDMKLETKIEELQNNMEGYEELLNGQVEMLEQKVKFQIGGVLGKMGALQQKIDGIEKNLELLVKNLVPESERTDSEADANRRGGDLGRYQYGAMKIRRNLQTFSDSEKENENGE